MRHYQLSFHLSSGATLTAVIEDDGLSVSDHREMVDQSINDDGTYTLLNIINEEWVVVQGKRIDAFGIIDLGENYLNEGFDIK